MNSKYGVFVVLLLACLVGVGCSPSQTLQRADDFRKVAEATQTASEKVRSILERWPAGTIEDNALATMIVDALPEDWQAKYRQAVAIAGDARTAAWDIVAALDSTSSDSLTEADKLTAQAAEEADKWSNFRAIAESAISVALAPEGIVMVGLGLLAGFFRKRQVTAEGHTADVVSSIQASPAMRAALDADGGAQVRAAMPTGTQKVVRKIKDSI